jgi:hypothetical protein
MDQQPMYGNAPAHRSKHPGVIVLVILLVLALATAGGFGALWAMANQKLSSANSKNDSNTKTIKELKDKVASLEAAAKAAQDGMVGENFIIKAWGVTFKVPVEITEVKYSLINDTAYIIAKPTNTNVNYADGVEADPQKFALGTITRSAKSVMENESGNKVDGKKIGAYYFYTSWSFSSLKAKSGELKVYGDGAAALQLEGQVFKYINDEMLPTISAVE